MVSPNMHLSATEFDQTDRLKIWNGCAVLVFWLILLWDMSRRKKDVYTDVTVLRNSNSKKGH